jgi:4-hydroxyphenylacetate 3-hydroxylase, reductase component
MRFDPREFRRALSKFATGVTVVTTIDQEKGRLGVTASSFNTVSLDPPLILWSVEKRALSANVFTAAENFVINVLASDQVAISNRFARRGEDKFSGVECREGGGGSPIIGGAVAFFECRVWNVYEGGDHHIIVGEVLNFQCDEERNSLVFHNGRYATPEQHPVTKEVSASRSANGMLGQSLIYLLRQAYSGCCGKFYPRLADYDVTAEEWRVLTLLKDCGTMEIDDIGARVMQPPKELRETIGWLHEKSLVDAGKNEVIELTEKGLDAANVLLQLANDVEAEMLASLNGINDEQLKVQLRKLADM